MARGIIRHGRQAQALGLVLVGLALLMRILVPPGWMPATDDGIRLILCGGLASEADHAAMGHGPDLSDHAGSEHRTGVDHSVEESKKDPSDGTMDQPCAFAAFSAALAPVTPVKLVMPVPFAMTTLAVFGEVAIGRGLAAPPPPSTGPPAAF